MRRSQIVKTMKSTGPCRHRDQHTYIHTVLRVNVHVQSYIHMFVCFRTDWERHSWLTNTVFGILFVAWFPPACASQQWRWRWRWRGHRFFHRTNNLNYSISEMSVYPRGARGKEGGREGRTSKHYCLCIYKQNGNTFFHVLSLQWRATCSPFGEWVGGG